MAKDNAVADIGANKTKNLTMSLKKHGNRSTSVVLLIIIMLVGYIFFFSSKDWVSDVDKNFVITEIGSTQSLSDKCSVKLTRWNYSEKQRVMEVELEINNTSSSYNTSYDFDCYSRPESTKASVEVVAQDMNLIVLHITNVSPKFDEYCLRMGIFNSNDTATNSTTSPQADNIIKLYTNKLSVERVDNIESKSLNEYYKDRILQQINEFNLKIDSLDSDIVKYQELNTELNNTISELEKSKAFQTDNEMIGTDEKIKRAKDDIVNNQKYIKDAEQSKREYQNKIAKANEKYVALNNVK